MGLASYVPGELIPLPLSGSIRNYPMLQKSQKALRLIFRQRTKQAIVADQCGLEPATGIACELAHGGVVSHIIFQSPRLRLGEFESHPAKRLLQQYLPHPDITSRLGRPRVALVAMLVNPTRAAAQFELSASRSATHAAVIAGTK
jgi:hypothetical protein